MKFQNIERTPQDRWREAVTCKSLRAEMAWDFLPLEMTPTATE